MAEGRFRADLFYRLNVIPIKLPPLRHRRDDIPLLIDHFLKRHDGSAPKLISKEAMELLMKYDWPGNVRELENVMERALVLDESGVIGPDGPARTRSASACNSAGRLVIDSPTMTLEELEKEYILKVLNHTRWQKKRASEVLGINASTLYRKLIGYGFERARRTAWREEHAA